MTCLRSKPPVAGSAVRGDSRAAPKRRHFENNSLKHWTVFLLRHLLIRGYSVKEKAGARDLDGSPNRVAFLQRPRLMHHESRCWHFCSPTCLAGLLRQHSPVLELHRVCRSSHRRHQIPCSTSCMPVCLAFRFAFQKICSPSWTISMLECCISLEWGHFAVAAR